MKYDEHDEVVNEFINVGKHQYKISCKADLHKMFELFNLRNELDIATVSGWVTYELGKIPNVVITSPMKLCILPFQKLIISVF